LPVVGVAALVALGALSITISSTPESGPSAVSVKDVASSTISTSSDTSTTASAATSMSASPEPPPPPSPLDKLYGVLPPGYSSSVCSPAAEPAPQALATVDCRELDIPDGPTSARFSLFADTSGLAGQFQDGVNTSEVSQCPGEIDSPLSWHYPATPDFSAGSLLCGTHDGAPVLTWTKNDALLLGSVQGPSLDNLYGWWLSLG
jgi:serine/threonine kinase PknH